MQSTTQAMPISPTTFWAGRIISALAVLILLFAGIIKVLNLPSTMEGTVQPGYPVSLIPIIGIIELACVAVYIIPRTSVLGAILLTGYLGGAVATNMQVSLDLFTISFPIILGVLLWGGLFLRDEQLQALIPLRSRLHRERVQ